MSNDFERLQSLINKREKYFARLNATYKLGKKCLENMRSGSNPDSMDMESFRSRRERAPGDFDAFERTTEDMFIVNAKLPTESQIDVNNGVTSYEELYFKVIGMHKTLFPEVPTAAPNTSKSEGEHSIRAKLPKIEIAPFSGEMKEWPNFFALYESLIHKNDSLNRVQKMTYLRSYLRGHALGLIENITIAEENYIPAYKTLVDRFQSRRLLGTAYLERIFSFKPITEESLAGFNNFLEVFGANLAALKHVGIEDLFDFAMLHTALRLLPPNTRREFENSITDEEIPSLDRLVEFIQRQARTLELGPRKAKSYSKDTKSTTNTRSALLSAYSDNSCHPESNLSKRNERPCAYCQSHEHKIFRCPAFGELELSDRLKFAKSKPLCFRCLGFHFVKTCQSTSNCFYCKSGSHHSLLHRSDGSDRVPLTSNADVHCESDAPPSKETLSCGLAGVKHLSSALLNTAIIGITDADGQVRPVRAIIDGGSQISLITEACAQRLRLRRRFAQIDLSAIANTTVPGNRGAVVCNVQPIHNDAIKLTTDALILPQIASEQPNAPVEPTLRTRFDHLKLADPHFDKRAPIEFLIGADLYMDIINDSHNIIKGRPGAMSTIFGWVIGGPTSQPSTTRPTSLLACCEELNDSLKRFWETESIRITPVTDPADLGVERNFQETHHRDLTGRYVVSLPFRGQPEMLPDTRRHAVNRLINFEKRLGHKPQAYLEYRETMQDYIDQGHMSISVDPFSYTMPHHCVFKESSSTTKVRTVFNASFRLSSSSPSLNDLLETGPKLQRDINHVISHLRFGPIVVCSDIRQMYRQVLVEPKQRHYQQICFRPNEGEDPKFFTLNTLTFGVKSSAYLAQRVLIQLVEDEGKAFPLASEAVKQWTFVDNICTSVGSVKEGLELQQELITLLKKGGFELRKWTSNHQSILDTVPREYREHMLVLRSEEDDNNLKVLGLQYDPATDSFAYSISCNPMVATKRGILSEISRIYDPLGWLSPLSLTAKHLIQETWLAGIGWDDELPPRIYDEWLTLREQLTSLSDLKISRYVPVNLASRMDLITFCDASNKGMSAVCYLRVEMENEVQIHLIAAKCKVSPLKTESIPRLELGAALLASKLAASLRPVFEGLDITASYFFTDATVVLSWLQTPPHKLKTFVANRVVDILEETKPTQWLHVPSALNPADCASRGMLPDDLVAMDIWWKGPPFLQQSPNQWPTKKPTVIPEEDIPDLKGEKKISCAATKTCQIDSPYVEIINRCSSLVKAYRTVAWIKRLIHNAHNRHDPVKTPLSGFELRAAMDTCIREIQRVHFQKDMTCVRDDLPCSKPIQKLAPFVDNAGIFRVGGRIKNAHAPFATRHPIILPFDSNFTVMLINHYHALTLHSGPRLVQSLIQRKYWVPSLRRVVRLQIQKCLTCHKIRAQPQSPLMANLPKERIRPTRPFLNVGVDYAGPITFKENLRRRSVHEKGYLAVFVCMVTKAAHLEFVSSLSTSAFLAVLDRFTARRGVPLKIFSDCGSNFRGAANHFDKISKMLQESREPIADHLSTKGVDWVFNPPSAPHMGGLWEAGVKSAKHHLLRVLKNMVPTFEEMITITARVEAVLNSRPLGAITSSPDDDNDFLTPGHFLIGSPLLAMPESDLMEEKISHLERYQLTQQAVQCLWRRWSKDYMVTLIPRSKWAASTENLATGEVVFIRNENTPSLSWPIGRILEVYPGGDGVIRVAKVKTPLGTYVRPAHKLLRLPPLTSEEHEKDEQAGNA